jgi:hypothetical protein
LVEAFSMVSSWAAAPTATTMVLDGTIAWIALVVFVATSALAVLAAGWLSHAGGSGSARPVSPTPPTGGARRRRRVPPVAAASVSG